MQKLILKDTQYLLTYSEAASIAVHVMLFSPLLKEKCCILH